MSPATRSRLLMGMIGLFLTAGLTLLTVFNSTKPRIVIVHSLSQDSTWTGPVDQGMRAALASNRIPVSVTRDFLNLDLLSQDADLGALASGLRRRIDSIDPSVLVLVDDETSDLIGRHYADRPGMSVIYTGLLGDPRSYGYSNPARVIGIREVLPLSAIAGLIEYARGGRPARIAVIGASTKTGLAEMQQVRDHDWAPHQLAATESVPNFEAWKRFVQGPAGSADVLIALTMDHLARDSGQPRSVPEEEIATWTESNAVPLPIGVRSSYVRHGGALAVSAPPLEYGRGAIELALKRVANPRFAPEGGSISLDAYDVSMRLSALEQRGVSLPGIYRQAARGAGFLYR